MNVLTILCDIGVVLNRTVEGVPKDRCPPCFSDQPFELMARHAGAGGTAGRMGDAFVEDRAVEIVGAEVEGDLGDLLTEHDPVGLEVGNVVE